MDNPFAMSWADEIANITTTAEFQNCTVRITDPSLLTATYNAATNTTTYTGDAEIYEGRARIIAVRWGVNRENNELNNPHTLTSITVQLPSKALGRVKRGCKLRVLESESNPALTTYWLTCTSDFQGSHVASRTLEFSVEGDAV